MKTKTFFHVQMEIFEAFKEGHIEHGLSLVKEAEQFFPEREEKLSFWKSCAYSRIGKTEEAIEVLQDARNKGIWWGPFQLQHDPDLKYLQGIEEFESIVAECKTLFERNELGAPEFRTFGNEQSSTGILSIHWRGSNIEDFAPYWTGADEFFFGFPQSSQIYSTNMFCWDDAVRAEEEVELANQQFLEGRTFKHVLVSGASQGGKLAIKRALSDTCGNIDGFIAVVPAIRDPLEVEEWLKKATGKARGVIITGDQDVYHPNIMSLQPLFEQYGVACKFFTNEGVGHDFPQNFTHQLRESVKFILQDNKG
ncbi:hypothetical protein ACFOZY_04425 [Chungangia koreensis]|uniref:BCE-2095-like N-terminal domain-containing protein n=1 Tax=Chungangia koreensis TaxID=752657 RepID=A0ABV8X3H6_9LACT